MNEMKTAQTKSGIYCIYNRANNKRYIGQTINLDGRRCWHFSRLRFGSHHNEHLLSSFLKYGEKSFEWLVLEYVAKERLDSQERAWIRLYNSDNKEFGYNKEDEGCLLHSHSKETKDKMSRAAMGNHNCLGHKHTEDSLRKMSIAKMNHEVSMETRTKLSKAWEKRMVSEETKRKMSLSQRKRNVSSTHNLQVLYPEIAIEFDLEKNYPCIPCDFAPTARAIVWWKCKEGHCWKSDIHRRTGKIKHGCPVCGAKRAQATRKLHFLMQNSEQHCTILA